jgi:hypothetical protein
MVTDNKALKVYFFRRLVSSDWKDGKLIYTMKNGTDLGKAMLVVDEILTSDAISVPAGGVLIYEDGTQSVNIPAYSAETGLKLSAKQKIDIQKAIQDFKIFWEDSARPAQSTFERVIDFELLLNSGPDGVLQAISLYLIDRTTPGDRFTINFTMKGGGFLGKLKFGV